MSGGPLREATLLAALLSWAALLALLAGVGRLRLDGAPERGVAFLLVAALTRLAFTDVRTRWQIAAFVLVATLAVAARAGPGGFSAAAARWAGSVAGSVAGAVAMREVVHRYLERWL